MRATNRESISREREITTIVTIQGARHWVCATRRGRRSVRITRITRRERKQATRAPPLPHTRVAPEACPRKNWFTKRRITTATATRGRWVVPQQRAIMIRIWEAVRVTRGVRR